MAGFFSLHGTSAQFGVLVAVVFVNCGVTLVWRWKVGFGGHPSPVLANTSQSPFLFVGAERRHLLYAVVRNGPQHDVE